MAKRPDWEAIESTYRAGVMSFWEIAPQHDISEGAIRKRATRDDWSRELNAKIKARSDDMVRKQEVRRQVRTETSLSERKLSGTISVDSRPPVSCNTESGTPDWISRLARVYLRP